MSRNEILNNVIAGSVSGCASVMVCHPLDVLRIKMQTESRLGVTTQSIIHETIHRQGWASLYRGFWAPFFAQAVYKSVIFSTNAFVSRHIFTGQRTSLTVFSSGFIAGSVNSMIVSPVELVRTRQVLSLPSVSSSPSGSKIPVQPSLSACIRTILAEPQGLGGFWRGLVPTMIRDGPGVGFYLLAFEFCKTNIHSARGAGAVPGSATDANVALSTRIASASCAGIAYWLWALPVDTLKTWIEASPLAAQGSTLHTSTRIFGSFASRGSGRQLVRQLFRAWPVALARGIPSAVVTLITYGLVFDLLEK